MADAAYNGLVLVPPAESEARVLVRQLYPWEQLSPELADNWAAAPLDYHWVWVTEQDSKLTSCVIAAPCHSMVMFLRIGKVKEAASSTLLSILRRVLADCSSRGYKGYAVCLDPELPAEAKLIRLVARAGGAIGGKGLWFGGPTDIGRL